MPNRRRRWLTYVFAVILGTGAAAGPATAGKVPFAALMAISTTADGARAVIAADLDGDGDLDALSASWYDDKIAWYENDGMGDSWTPHTISITADFPRSIFAADMDSDGDLDALSASVYDHKITWYENDGNGENWTLHTISTTAYGPFSVFAADVDGDGDLDAWSASVYDDKVAWYENDGNGSNWTLHTISTTAEGARSVFAADLDGDGDLDALSTSTASARIAWYENDGSGSSWTLHTISTASDGAYSAIAADVDGDGDLDALSAAPYDNKIAWYENDGSGDSWTLHTISTAAQLIRSVFSSDVDGDGDLDALSASPGVDLVAWYENDGTGTSWTLHTISTAPSFALSVFAADMDGDGDIDALSASRDDDTIAWYRNDTIHRSAAFSEKHVIANADGAWVVSAADLDGDGDPDAVRGAGLENTLAWHENDGMGSFGTLHTVSTSNSRISQFPADLDGDGDLDLFTPTQADGTRVWYENDGGGGTWTVHSFTTEIGVTHSVFAMDVDGDGDVDTVSGKYSHAPDDPSVAWFENDGAGGSWTKHPISAADLDVNSVFPADVDGDGDLDVLSGGREVTTAWHENHGSGSSWSLHTIFATPGYAVVSSSVVAADIDGDGDLDAVSDFGGYVGGGSISWYENDGTGSSWTRHVITSDAVYVHSLLAADVDGDGDQDLLAAGSPEGEAFWFENEGGGMGWIAHSVTTDAYEFTSIFAADIDRDGDLDVLAASFFDDEVAWYENLGGQFALPTTDVGQKVVGNGEFHDLLAVQVVHRGRAGDSDVELAALELLLTDGSGVPLTTLEANDLIQELRVYLDDGSGSFEESPDTLVTTVINLSLTAGVQTIPFVDGDPLVRVAYGNPKTYFVVTEITADAESQVPAAFAATHLTEASSTGEDAGHDIPLTLEHAANVGTGTIHTALTSASCQAPFDLELADRTVSATLVCKAGRVLRAGSSFVVVAGGDVTFRAGEGVELKSGFQVQGGAFTAEVDPSLQP